jgi:glycosyltransferase involved in cell wall biosynthesis
MTKLIIQIPCFNEEETLPITLAALPRELDGFDTVEWLVINDGSTDRTSEVARSLGVDHIIDFDHNSGLAKAFMAGVEYCLRQGADVIINTDADNQYSAESIPDLVRPILNGKAKIVVGARPISEISHFSPLKKALQKLGSWVVKVASGTSIPDAPSGFRAIHKDAAVTLYVFNGYTYTLETIIQAGRRDIPIASVPIKVNGYLRPSRLISSIPKYIYRSIITIIRIFIIYKPLRFFLTIAAVLSVPALISVLRFLYFYFSQDSAGHIQSLVLASALLAIAAALTVAGIIADLMSANRILLEDIRRRILISEIKESSRDT